MAYDYYQRYVALKIKVKLRLEVHRILQLWIVIRCISECIRTYTNVVIFVDWVVQKMVLQNLMQLLGSNIVECSYLSFVLH